MDKYRVALLEGGEIELAWIWISGLHALPHTSLPIRRRKRFKIWK